jgi:hypothetical protein
MMSERCQRDDVREIMSGKERGGRKDLGQKVLRRLRHWGGGLAIPVAVWKERN